MYKRYFMCCSLALVVACALGIGCGKQASEPAATPPGAVNTAPSTLAGTWESVDFVRNVDDFKPGQKSWQGDLFLKDFTADAGGGTSQGWTWTEGWITHSNGTTRAQYYIKEIDGTSCLFLPWLSGDVTERGQQPSYYVMKPSGAASPSAQPSSPATAQAQTLAGDWVSVDFVRSFDDFKPGQKSWQGDLFLTEFRAELGGGTSLGWTWTEGSVTHSNGTTRFPYLIKEIDGTSYLFLPWLSGDVTERGQQPSYYVMVSAGGATPSAQSSRPAPAEGMKIIRAGESFMTIRPIDSVSEFDDVRYKDMSALNLAGDRSLIATLNFNTKSVWPASAAMPPGISPKNIANAAMNPGLGVRGLHQQGISGKGVKVAIIDQPLYDDHPEFAGKIAAYHDVGCKSESSMHGPAVASLLVGSNCGTAPGATLYFVAAPSWTKDTAFQSEALDWIVEQNAALPDGQKIRVVSVSAAPSGQGSPFEVNQGTWDGACARAEAAGIMVLDCTHHHGFISACYYDAHDPENVSKCKAGFPGMNRTPPAERLLVPASPRTVAEEYEKGDCTYQYCGRGGLSWAIPYCAGVLAMGWEVRPDLTPAQMRDLLFESAYTGEQETKFINPPEFIRMVKEAAKSAG
jgi:hypothetical protein